MKPTVLAKFRAALRKLYGPRIERVVLFGSRARGDARRGSDYDIAIFLRDLDNRDREVDLLADLQDQVMAYTDPFIDAIPFRAGGVGGADDIHARVAARGRRTMTPEAKAHLHGVGVRLI